MSIDYYYTFHPIIKTDKMIDGCHAFKEIDLLEIFINSEYLSISLLKRIISIF